MTSTSKLTQKFMELLCLLKEQSREYNIDLYIQATNLHRYMVEEGYEIKPDELAEYETSVYDSQGTLLPYLDPEIEKAKARLRFKFEVKVADYVPTLLIHSKEAIDEECFEDIYRDIEKEVEETASLTMINPFLLVETHTYCLDLESHIALLHGILNKNLYEKKY